MSTQHTGSTLWPQSLILLKEDGTVWFDSTDTITADYHYRNGAVDADVAWAIADATTGQVTPGSPSTGLAGTVRVIIWRTTSEGYRQSYGEELLWGIVPSSVTGAVASGTGYLQTVTVNVVPTTGATTASATLTDAVAVGTDADLEVWSNLGEFPPIGAVYAGAGTVTLSSDRLTVTVTLPAGATWASGDWCRVRYKTRG